MKIKNIFVSLRNIYHKIIPNQTMEFLHLIRAIELNSIIERLPDKKDIKILEIGAGTGEQARILSEMGYNVFALDINTSIYKDNKVFNITYYDGEKIPFQENSFDVVFSSSVLEHVYNIEKFQQELLRITKPGGMSIHLIPSVSWRLLTSITGMIKWWTCPVRHGEHANGAWDEILYLQQSFWVEKFRSCGWKLAEVSFGNILYSGYGLFDKYLSTKIRIYLAKIFNGGSSIYVLIK